MSSICGLYALVSVVNVARAAEGVLFAADTGDPVVDHIMSPIAQLGFAGAFVLASALVWWFAWTRRVDWNTWHTEQLKTLKETSIIVTRNTEAHIRVVDALTMLTARLMELSTATTHLTEQMLCRPCLSKDEEKRG